MVASVSVEQSHENGIDSRSGGDGHVLEGHVVSTVEGKHGVVGISGIACKDHLLVVGAHTPKGDSVGLAGSVDDRQGDILFIGSWRDLKEDWARDTLFCQGGSCST